MHEVVDHTAGDLGGGHRRQFDALVLLHLGGGGTENVDQRDGASPPAARLLAREDEEVFAVTAHSGREVVELEEDDSWSGSASRDSSSEMSES